MEILSSSRICKIILTILSVVLLYNVSTKAQGLNIAPFFSANLYHEKFTNCTIDA